MGNNLNIRLPSFLDFLTSVERPIPQTVLNQLYELIIDDNMLLPMALCHYDSVKVSAGIPLLEALFKIFSYTKKIHLLYTALAVMEFSSDILTENTVLRVNSHLTNLIKVLVNKYGKSYYNGFLKSILDRIDKIGYMDISKIASLSEQDIETIKTLLLTFLNEFSNSQQHISPEIRHMASVLKYYCTIRFNTENASYNVLSGYFFLRICSSILSNPNDADPTKPFHSDLVKVFIPCTLR